MAKQNQTHEDRIVALEFKDERRDNHMGEIKKDVKAIADMQKEILMVLGGSPLNKNKGALDLLTDLKSKIETIELAVERNTSELSQVKFWGRGASGVAFVSLGLMVKKLFNL